MVKIHFLLRSVNPFSFWVRYIDSQTYSAAPHKMMSETEKNNAAKIFFYFQGWRCQVEVSASFFSFFKLFFVLRHYAHVSCKISLSPRYNTRVKSKIVDRPAKLHTFGMKVQHFTCSSRTNFPYIFYKFTHFRFSCSPYIKIFFKIVAVAAQIHTFYLLKLCSYETL